jgi:hypothetical protein
MMVTQAGQVMANKPSDPGSASGNSPGHTAKENDRHDASSDNPGHYGKLEDGMGSAKEYAPGQNQ